MILTDDEMEQVRGIIEAQAGLDEELVQRCGHLIHIGSFDEAVRSAFVLLEERLREATNREGMTGVDLVNHAFSPENGPLAKLLAHSKSEAEGLRELYSGAFKLFRNPTAHGVVGYSATEGKAIIGLVNLLLGIVERAGEIPAPGAFPENVEGVLTEYEEALGPAALGRLRNFLGKCVQLGVTPSPVPKVWIPFRKYAYVRMSWWDAPKSHPMAMFYIGWARAQPVLQFPVSGYYAGVVGLDTDELLGELNALGFVSVGKNREPTVYLKSHSDQKFFDSLLHLVTRTRDRLEDSLSQR